MIFCPYINEIPKFYTPVYSDQLGEIVLYGMEKFI